jgi:hypothetical protein
VNLVEVNHDKLSCEPKPHPALNIYALSANQFPSPKSRTVVESTIYEDNVIIVQIGSVLHTAIIDTGCDRSVCNHDLYKELKKSNPHLTLDPCEDEDMNTAGQQTLKPLGDICLEAKIEGHPIELPLRVLDNLRPRLLLGNDFLRANSALIDTSRAKVRFKFHNLPVRSLYHVSIPPRAERSIPVRVDGHPPNGLVGMVSPIELSGSDDPIFGAWTVNRTFEEGKTALRILNLSDDEYEVKPQEIIGHFSALSSKEIIDLEHPNACAVACDFSHPHSRTAILYNGMDYNSSPPPILSQNDESSFERESEESEYTQENFNPNTQWQNEGWKPQPEGTLIPIKDEDINLDGSYLSPEQANTLRSLIKKNRDVFALSIEELSQASGPPCYIRLKPGHPPVKSPPYKASPSVMILMLKLIRC